MDALDLDAAIRRLFNYERGASGREHRNDHGRDWRCEDAFRIGAAVACGVREPKRLVGFRPRTQGEMR